MAKPSGQTNQQGSMGETNDSELMCTTPRMMDNVSHNLPTPPSSAGNSSKAVRSECRVNIGNTMMVSSVPLLVLPVCRHVRWRNLQCFGGRWLQITTYHLANVAEININSPRPHPIDPAVLYDVVKVRKCIDEAVTFELGAANGCARSTVTNANCNMASKRRKGIGQDPKLSIGRRHWFRELACQRLARGYRVDDAACSRAVLEITSALKDTGKLVLQRDPDNINAKLVHFFHERLPLRQEFDLQSLTEIIESGCGKAETLRTRATLKLNMRDFEGALQDLTEALSDCQHLTMITNKYLPKIEQTGASKIEPKKTPSDNDQPNGLKSQVLFCRASVYLLMACHNVHLGFDANLPQAGHKEVKAPDGTPGNAAHMKHDLRAQMESRNVVKTLAERALKDYVSFLSHLEYSPSVPYYVIQGFYEQVDAASRGHRKQSKLRNSKQTAEGHVVYPVSDLFSHSVSPAFMTGQAACENKEGASTPTCEVVTYHPLLTDVLHATLLCHCLIQTPVQELQNHAYLVARLVRISNGHPVFNGPKSTARDDWVEVIQRTQNWLQLRAPWDELCTPSAHLMKLLPVKPELDSLRLVARKAVEYPIRVEAVTRWILEAPIVPGKRKGRKLAKKSSRYI